MGCANVTGNTRVLVQTRMSVMSKNARESAELLSRTLRANAGYINNETDGIAGLVGGYLPNSRTEKDVLNEYTYRTLNAQGATLIITHGAGNEDARKALQVGVLYGHSYENLSFFSVGSPVPSSVLEKAVTRAGGTYMGQVNDWWDPMTYSKTAGTAVVGSFVGGLVLGAVQGCAECASTGLLGCISWAAAGAAPGAAAGVMSVLGLGSFHPFQQYLAKPKVQSIMFDWLKNSKGK